MIKKLIKKNFASLVYFYRHLGYRMLVALGLSFSVGLLDGFGLAMFLPLLQMVTGGENADASQGMGGMDFILEGFTALNIPLNLQSVLLVIIIFFLFKGIATFARTYYSVIVQMFFIKSLRFRNIDGLVGYRYKAFVMADTGRIQNTLSGEVGRVSGAYRSYFETIQALVMMAVYMGLAFVTNPQFAVLVVVGGLLSNLAYRQVYKRTKMVSAQITTGGHRFQRQLIQIVGHFKYLKATALLKQYARKLKDSVVYIEEANRKIGFYNSLLAATREPLNIVVVAGVILAQVYWFSAALSGIILALLFFYRALNYVMGFQTSWNGFLNVSGSLDNMTRFMQELHADKEHHGTGVFDDFKGAISLEKVKFNYGETPILKDVSLQIPTNSSVALVGESGSGKTTLVNLISGLMQVDGGAIYVDGKDYRSIDIRSLQKHIGYISQDPVIFSDSIYDNVSLWAKRSEANIARFWEACEKAAIAEFIHNLPQGLDTPLGNNGIQLSGGQKQRLSIARELYKEVSILIMDEATSALDSTVEREIQENIDALKGEYTMIIVAHRLSTVRNVDCIYLMSDGQIESAGNFNELQRKSSRFKRMVELQEF